MFVQCTVQQGPIHYIRDQMLGRLFWRIFILAGLYSIFCVFRWVVTPTVKTTWTCTFFHHIVVKARQYVLNVRVVPRGGCPAPRRDRLLARATTTTLRADHASRVRETRGARDERCATTIRIDAMPRIARSNARLHAREDARGDGPGRRVKRSRCGAVASRARCGRAEARVTREGEGEGFERTTDRVYARARDCLRDVGERDRAMRETGVRRRDGAGAGVELGRDQDGGSVRCVDQRALGIAKGGV